MPAYFRHRKDFVNPKVPNDQEILSILRISKQAFPLIKFQITTKGNEFDVVKRGVESIASLTNTSLLFSQNIEILIVTDEPDELNLFSKLFQKLKLRFPSEVIVVPKDYKTPNNTVMKARSLQYSLEYRKLKERKIRSIKSTRSFIYYFDAESTISEIDFRRVIHSIITSSKIKVFEGPIVYPHKYFESNILSRQMESTRPFHCHHCVQVMKKPPPIHLHGSNLLVAEDINNSVGWDFGKYKEQPLLAEDLIFGLKVYSKYGPEVFGWHGGQISEQPPLSIRDSIRARLRWISGAWQAISLFNDPEFSQLSKSEKFWPLLRLRLRLITHSLTFFAALFVWMTFIIIIFPSIFYVFHVNKNLLPMDFRVFQLIVSYLFFLPGSIFWIFSVLNGTSKNIKPLNLTKRKQLFEYMKIVIVTPIAGAIESFCAFYATTRWIIGRPYNSWNVTGK